MGYGGAPPWVYKQEIALRDLSHNQETGKLNSEIQGLKKENQELKARIEELEAEINDLRWYKFEHPEKDQSITSQS
jgi:predicted RNase H-like nuclease (RuvC/YqgF family)